MATYSIIGAGSSSGNPVTVFMGCEDSVNICWTGRKTTSGYCSECYYFDDQYCSTISGISVSTTGTVSWQGNSVYYKIVKSCQPEPTPQPCSSYTYSDFSFYTVPTYVEADYDGYIDIYYSYTVTCLHGDGSIGGIDNLSDMESVPFSSFTSGNTVYTYDFAPISDVCSACSGVAQVYISSDEDTCDSGTTVNVTTTFSPSVVPALPASGTDVTINIRCKTVEVDEDCTKRVTNTSSALTWHVSCATDCCIDHVVSSSITVSDIRAIAGVDSTATIKYNGVKVISTLIPYSITQKAKYTEECSGSSDDKETKYCVDSGSVKVEYETTYLSNRWAENGVVPFGGGRIKVSWNYSACTDSLCTPNTWEEIIEVESCDEREESPGDGCIYARGSDGRVSGSCVIYFKEQSDDCGTCEGESPGEGYGVFNKITYNFEQDCQTTCQDYTNIIYDKQTITVDKCFTGTTSTTVPYSSITEHIGLLCPSEPTIVSGSVDVVVNITSINNSDSARTIFESDKVIVEQEAGPCSSDTQCGVAVKLESGLEGTDTAFLGFTDTEGTAQYNARNGELIEYYTDDNDGVSVTIESDSNNNEDYRYKLVGRTDYITGFNLGCGESASTVAVKYCGCKKLQSISGETAITADGGDSITVAIYSATCDSLNLEVIHVNGTDEILDLSVDPVFNSDSTLTAKVTENTSPTDERTGTYKVYDSVKDEYCDNGTFTITQKKAIEPVISIITYYSPSKLNVNLNDFTPAATAETFSSGVGKVEFSAVVTGIGEKAFSGETAMTGIEIPDSITSIGNSAFTNCNSLTSIDIPDSVTSIGNYAFYNCSSLPTIDIPSGVTNISNNVFQYCNSLTSCTIGSGVTTIGDSAFRNCSGLTSINIPNSVTSIGNSAFTNCNSLTSITIPSGVESINNYLLYNCTSLSSVTLGSETLQLKPYSISNCPNLRKIEMTSVTACPSDYQNALENSADCPIYVPEQYLDKFWNSSTFSYADRVISHIGDNCVVYKANSKLDGANLDRAYSVSSETAANKLSITSNIFNSSTKIGKITYNGTVRSFHDDTFNTMEEIYIILPEGLQVIGQEVFISNYNLKSIFIPNSVVRLGKYADEGSCETFHNCTSLKRFVAGSGLTSIGTQCFVVSSPAYTGFTFYSTNAPTLYHRNTFDNTGSCPIYVPCGRVNSYKTSNIWNDSTISNRIKAIPPCTS